MRQRKANQGYIVRPHINNQETHTNQEKDWLLESKKKKATFLSPKVQGDFWLQNLHACIILSFKCFGATKVLRKLDVESQVSGITGQRANKGFHFRPTKGETAFCSPRPSNPRHKSHSVHHRLFPVNLFPNIKI